MGSMRSEKNIRNKLIQDKCQVYLSDLLKDEDNKYCVDCDAKGPRWASWNLGILLCIRCAGIHRNLGVHISKVKSINLDAWTPEQVALLKQMGNRKARTIYEANLPDNFRRPQTDSTLEPFIRQKYEQKKFIAKEWVPPPTPPPAFDIEEERKKDKERKKHKNIKNPSITPIIDVQTNPVPRPESKPASTEIDPDKILQNGKSPTSSVTMTKSASADLLGLGLDTGSDDTFEAFISASRKMETTKSDLDLSKDKGSKDEDNFFNQKDVEGKKLDKESILKLYETCTTNIFPPTTTTPQKQQQQQQLAYQGGNPNLVLAQPLTNVVINGGQATQPFFPATTNPFLANTNLQPTSPAMSQLQMQISSLQMSPKLVCQMQQQSTQQAGTTIATNELIGLAPNQSSSANNLLPGGSAGLINPFIQQNHPLISTDSGGMQGGGAGLFDGLNSNTSRNLLETFAQASGASLATNNNNSQQWFNPVSDGQPAVPSTMNLWQ